MKKEPKIRVLHINSAADVGGGEEYLLALASGMRKRGYISSFVCPYYGVLVERLKRNGFDVDVIDIDSHRFHPVPFFQLYWVMRNKQVHIVHTHGARANFYGRSAARLAGVPIILSTVHNSLRDYIVSGFKKQVYLLALSPTTPS